MAHSLFSGSTHTKAQAPSGNVNSLWGNQEEKNVPDHAKSLQEQPLNRKTIPLKKNTKKPKPNKQTKKSGKQQCLIRVSLFVYLWALNIRPGSLLKPNWFFWNSLIKQRSYYPADAFPYLFCSMVTCFHFELVTPRTALWLSFQADFWQAGSNKIIHSRGWENHPQHILQRSSGSSTEAYAMGSLG